ncbi:hypothetical protein V1522DRAFT_394421 [Lipomyces starkeyi]
MQPVSECSAEVEVDFDLPLPSRGSLINDVGPQNIYGHGTAFTLYIPDGNASVVIRIRKHLRVRELRHSQIVLAEIEVWSAASCPGEKQVVANFFDPLFVSLNEWPSDDAPARYRQIVTSGCYRQEVAAY